MFNEIGEVHQKNLQKVGKIICFLIFAQIDGEFIHKSFKVFRLWIG